MHWDLGIYLWDLLVPGWSDGNVRFAVSLAPVTVITVFLF